MSRIAVSTELVREFLLDRILAEVERLEPGTERPADPLERRGYLARVAETRLFPAARETTPDLAQALAGRTAPDLAAELAAVEPAARPEPGDPGAWSWRVPGPGGHVRHYLAVAEARLAGVGEEEGKRAWLRGFFLRCCEEVAGSGDEPLREGDQLPDGR